MVSREELESILLRDDIVEYLSSKSKEEIEDMFGEKVAKEVGFDQKNIHHCYDLFGHTLHTVEAISSNNLSKEETTRLKVAAFFHDIGKLDTAKFNSKTGQQVFYGHAEKSGEISKEILEGFGYSNEEIEQICFLVMHHDDFISYKTKLPEYMKHHEFLREINEDNVADKLLENMIDFNSMGQNKDQVRAICYELVYNKEHDFTSPNGIVDIDVDMTSVKENIALGKYKSKYTPSLKDYKLLLNLCRADATAQTELYKKDGKVLCSRKEKIQNIDSIDACIEGAYNKAESITKNICLRYSLINEVVDEAQKNGRLEENLKEAKDLKDEYEKIYKDSLEYNKSEEGYIRGE